VSTSTVFLFLHRNRSKDIIFVSRRSKRRIGSYLNFSKMDFGLTKCWRTFIRSGQTLTVLWDLGGEYYYLTSFPQENNFSPILSRLLDPTNWGPLSPVGSLSASFPYICTIIFPARLTLLPWRRMWKFLRNSDIYILYYIYTIRTIPRNIRKDSDRYNSPVLNMFLYFCHRRSLRMDHVSAS
jgi:hypothetical protein